jgi:hypothetical protein
MLLLIIGSFLLVQAKAKEKKKDISKHAYSENIIKNRLNLIRKDSPKL